MYEQTCSSLAPSLPARRSPPLGADSDEYKLLMIKLDLGRHLEKDLCDKNLVFLQENISALAFRRCIFLRRAMKYHNISDVAFVEAVFGPFAQAGDPPSKDFPTLQIFTEFYDFMEKHRVPSCDDSVPANGVPAHATHVLAWDCRDWWDSPLYELEKKRRRGYQKDRCTPDKPTRKQQELGKRREGEDLYFSFSTPQERSDLWSYCEKLTQLGISPPLRELIGELFRLHLDFEQASPNQEPVVLETSLLQPDCPLMQAVAEALWKLFPVDARTDSQ